jgi:hypothetical protein
MCGIAGIYAYRDFAPVDRELLRIRETRWSAGLTVRDSGFQTTSTSVSRIGVLRSIS